MTAFDVDVSELTAVISAMDAVGRALADLAGDVEVAHGSLHSLWTGLASDAHGS